MPIFKYEDLISNPKMVISRICEYLYLDYDESFVDTFGVFEFSGDSGRSGNVISGRDRLTYDEEFIEEVNKSMEYEHLINRLEYQNNMSV